MPTYEYVCSDCGNHWEEVQKISADPLEICPKCSKSTAKRQISGGNFILKGGGWYADLYSSSPKPKGGEQASSSGSSSPSTPAKSGDGAGSGASSGSGGSGSSGASAGGSSGGSGGSSGGSTGGSAGSSGGSGSTSK